MCLAVKKKIFKRSNYLLKKIAKLNWVIDCRHVEVFLFSTESELTLEIHADDYLGKLNPEASLQAYVSLNVDQTRQHYARSQAFTLAKPFLTITVVSLCSPLSCVRKVILNSNTNKKLCAKI